MRAENSDEIKAALDSYLEPKGFETYPFLVGWYNESVDKKFGLQYSADTLAVLVISTPEMFERATLPYIHANSEFTLDPVDQCIRHHMQHVRDRFPNVQVLHDYELDHNRRPKILVQSAGHCAGAAYYYQKRDVTNPPWQSSDPVYGVSVHPRYGGWFALRCVLIFGDVNCPNLPRKTPQDVVPGNEERIQLLEKFSFHWEDWTYRDIIPVEKKYSERQKEYFSTLPKNRKELVDRWKIEDNGVET